LKVVFWLLFLLVAIYAKDNNTSKQPFDDVPQTICEKIYNNNLQDFAKVPRKELIVGLYVDNCKKGKNFFWLYNNTKLNSRYLELIELSNQGELHSNKARDMIKTQTIALVSETIRYKDIIALDIELSNIFIKTIYHEYYGSINFDDMKRTIRNIKKKQDKKNKFEWDYLKKRINIKQFTKDSFSNDNIANTLSKLQTNYIQHQKLKKALGDYKKIQADGGWATVRYGRTLRYEANNPRVRAIKKRLKLTDGLIDDNTTIYNIAMKTAVVKFQKRHGLKADGNIGKTTIKKLNISVAKKIALIKLNLERHKWLPIHFPDKYLEINVPSFRVRVIKDGKTDYTTKVVVGKYKRPTPIFRDRLSSFVINPYWRVPQSIIQRDFVHKLMMDPTYAQRQNIKITRDGMRVAPTDINWFEYDEDTDIPYSFTQSPGNSNALGRVKFLFPNRFAVYLHDTNHKSLFRRNSRAYSSGCVRVYQPFELLNELVKDDKRYSKKNIKKHLKSEENRHFALKNKLDIYINYLTVYVDDDDMLYFYPDIYGYDRLQLKWM
jgi:murein L,D-transpeptidase YcbB/YkuD